MCDLSAQERSSMLIPPGALESIPGADGLCGAVSRNFVTIVGPCGEYHVLSKAATAALYQWLGSKLCTIPPPMGRHETGPVVGEWISDVLAKGGARG